MLMVVLIGSWLDRLRGVSKVQYWMVSPRLSVVEAANRSIEEFEEPLWWWKVESGGAWLWRSNLTQKFFQASTRKHNFLDFFSQLLSIA